MTTEAGRDFVLRVDKPEGPTSHDMVALARRTFGTPRVGHTGTLDPFASGLLLLCVNRATRIAEFLTGLNKGYQATASLDSFSTTDDLTGELGPHNGHWRSLTRSEVESAMHKLTGTIEQVPSAFSAKKIAGERAYRLARRGETVVHKPVTVQVHRLELTEFNLPFIRFSVECSSGTYVRALARDLGRLLGTGGYLTELRRLSIGEFGVEGAASAAQLQDGDIPDAARHSPLDALAFLPAVQVDEKSAERMSHGQSLPHAVSSPRDIVVVKRANELVALAREDGEWLKPYKVWSAA